MDSLFYLVDESGFRHQFENSVNFGFNSKSELTRLDEEIEARVCRIEKRDSLIYIRDLKGGEVILLNSNRLLEGFAQDGDILMIGKKSFQICFGKTAGQSKLKTKNLSWQARLNNLPNIAASEFPVLLLGASGSGKEGLAEEIHALSSRKAYPFVRFNCSALTETLAESELFGHVKGSFTGALSDRRGLFETARGGTLFLDEIGDLPYPLQAKLLRALENQEIRPVGSDRTIKTDVRIIAATHQNLSEKIYHNTFRADLYYRLNVIQLPVPSLADRPEDLEGLIFEFARQYRVRFSHSAILALKNHTWPGNIRELKNLVARASVLFSKKEILADDLGNLIEPPPRKQVSSLSELLNSHLGMGIPSLDQPQVTGLLDERVHETRANPDLNPVENSLEQNPETFEVQNFAKPLPPLKRIEKQMILERLKANRGNQRQTALELGIPKSTLHDRLRYYRIDPKSFSRVSQLWS